MPEKQTISYYAQNEYYTITVRSLMIFEQPKETLRPRHSPFLRRAKHQIEKDESFGL